MAKKKKERITYIDDGSTVADMSNVSGSRLPKRNPSMPSANYREAWHTYWGAVKMMFGPMMAVICGLGIVYMILYFVFLFL